MDNSKTKKMKDVCFTISLLFIVITSFSQEIPTITTDKSNLGLQKLTINVAVIGNIATTTYDMLFYNPKNRVLEGELSFPLGQNQTVTRFALDLNGELRDAVVVEKELGRVAYETTIRQNIDPALLEQTKGNNYKARIYPIPAKGTKRVVLSYQQELTNNNNEQYYHLPLNFKNKLTEFNLEFIVFDQHTIPIINSNYKDNFAFNKWNRNYTLEINKKDFIPNNAINIKIPNEIEEEKLIVNNDYFYFYKTFKPKTKLKKTPSKIILLWDVSLSMKNRNITNEILILENYLKHIKNVKITVKKFSNQIVEEKDFTIINGKSDRIVRYLQNSTYDGATSYKKILNFKRSYKECLLFTDGMDNLGEFTTKKSTPIYILNSVTTSNHKSLNKLAIKTGGNYLNLNVITVKQANHLLTNETFRFLGVKQNNKNKLEIYPNSITNISTDFSISGKNFMNDDEIELQFGYGNKVTKKVIVTLNKSSHQNKKIEKIWAQKKLTSLMLNKERNKSKIIKLSKTYQLISPYTSLIVLDRIEDYVRYKIEPPKELREEYKILLKEQIEQNENSEIQDLKEELMDEYEGINEWWNTDFKLVKIKKPEKQSNNTAQNTNVNIRENNNQTNLNTEQQTQTVTQNNEHLDPNRRIIKGVVTDEFGPVPYVTVKIKGKNIGAITNFDGNYAINAEINEVLIFSHIGYNSVEKTVNTLNNNVSLDSSGNNLEEVIVSAIAVSREKRSLSHTVTTVENSSISNDISRRLAGKVSGVNITMTSGLSGAGSEVIIRGAYSGNQNNKQLYIVDGIFVENDENIKVDKIDNVSFLKASDATALYGSKGANGIVIITTKKGLKENIKQIETFNDLVEEKLALKGWNPNASYLDKIKTGETIAKSYDIYLKLRTDYANQPTFYLDVSDYFLTKNEKEISIRILSNIAEIEINNYELLRAIAYKFESLNEYEQALYIYKEILKIRPEDIQTYRDLALCYQAIGNYQKALELLYKIVNGELLIKDKDRRFEGIETVAYVELNHLISTFKKKLNLAMIDKKYINPITADLRIVIDWNHNDTDIDLWVFDPNDEKCFFSHTKTEIGGKISEDMTEGFGPEEFMLKKSIKGNYQFKAEYYADNVQKISGPTILKVTTFTNYGKKNETKKVTVFRLDKEDDEIIKIGEFKI